MRALILIAVAMFTTPLYGEIHNSYGSAVGASRNDGKAMIVVVGIKNCPSCVELDTTFRFFQESNLLNNINYVYLDADTDKNAKKLVDHTKVNRFPQLHIMIRGGPENEWTRWIAYTRVLPYKDLVKVVKYAASKRYVK